MFLFRSRKGQLKCENPLQLCGYKRLAVFYPRFKIGNLYFQIIKASLFQEFI